MKPKAIKVEGISKKYQLGPKVDNTLRGTFAAYWKHLWREGAKTEPFWALRDISFTVDQGEIVGIIGNNGAGKSTLLKILSRITLPTSGRAVLEGRVASLLEVGTGFHHELTGRENIFLNGAILGMTQKEIKSKFDEIVAFSGVEAFLDTPVKHYSSGMFVRLAFAVAAHLEAEILLVDEVLAVGDVAFQNKSLGKMNEVANTGRTVIFVSHDLNKIGSFCDRLLWIDHGEIRMAGPPEKIIHAYRQEVFESFAYSGKYIKHIEIRSHGKRSLIIDAGAPFSIHVDFESPFPLRSPRLGLIIRDKFFSPVIGVNNYRYDQKFAEQEGVSKGSITVEFPGLPLLSGEYTVDLFLGDYQKDYEILENTAYFQIKARLDDPVMEQIEKETNKFYIKKIKWRLKA